MLEIKNKLHGPVQILVRSSKGPREFTTLIIPGIGSGKNVRTISDEMVTEYIDRLVDNKIISTKYVSNTSSNGE